VDTGVDCLLIYLKGLRGLWEMYMLILRGLFAILGHRFAWNALSGRRCKWDGWTNYRGVSGSQKEENRRVGVHGFPIVDYGLYQNGTLHSEIM
jgi:hypothetical protein